MARTKSAVKNIRKNERRNSINRSRRTGLRTQLKKLRELVKSKNAAGAREALPATLSLIDRSQSKGLLHRNTAARYKSRLSCQVGALGRSG